MLDKMDFQKFKDTGTLILWVIGGPGSGKSTLCSRLAEQFSFWHISVSELLNNLVASDSAKQNEDYTTLKKSRIIPTSIIIFLIKQEMAMHNDKKGFLIDGFPLDIEQGRKFEVEVIPVDCILLLNVDESTMIERLFLRSKMAKKAPEKITVVCDKIKAFRDFHKIMYENYSSKIQKINAKEDADAVQRKAAIKINDLIIKHFTMKILRNNNLIIPE